VFVPQPALPAYQRDSARLAHASHVEGLLVGVLVFARMLESTLEEIATATEAEPSEPQRDLRAAPLAEREAGLRAIAREHGLVPGDAPADASDASSPLDRVSELARRVADRAEQAGALHLANSILWGLERAEEQLSRLEQGRVLAQRARVARKANEHDVALRLYKGVAALGRTHGSGELRARAAAGFAVMAQLRGNLPLAARHFRTAAREAKRAGVSDLLRVAQHGQLTVAARRGAFSDALVHGWHAYQDAWGNPEAEAEMLLNLAQLAFDVGRTDAALAGFTAALIRRPGPRLALPALGGAARAAAALGRGDLLRHFARQVDAYRGDEGFAYPIAYALLDLAFGFARHDLDEASRRVRDALALTATYGFHELDFQLRDLAEELARGRSGSEQAVPIPVAPRGETVLRELLGEGDAAGEDGTSRRRTAAAVR
jgi:hypothetical protein